jgi:hypothetical protein
MEKPSSSMLKTAPCCDVRYDFRIITIFGSSLLPVVCSMSYLRYFCLLAYSGVQRILCCVFVFLVFVLCTLCCKFLEIVLFWLPLRYSLTVIIYIHGVVMFRLASVIVPNVTHSPQCFGVVMFRLASVIVPNSFSFLAQMVKTITMFLSNACGKQSHIIKAKLDIYVCFFWNLNQ